jgi:hypothetical protein
MSSLEHFPAKESKPRQRRARVNVAPASYGVREFCDAHSFTDCGRPAPARAFSRLERRSS